MPLPPAADVVLPRADDDAKTRPPYLGQPGAPAAPWPWPGPELGSGGHALSFGGVQPSTPSKQGAICDLADMPDEGDNDASDGEFDYALDLFGPASDYNNNPCDSSIPLPPEDSG
uniref:Uncharacterized protein n=1 Tax=Leersia perrieri TaxID=77586 RepID=A0A0D9V9D8_9ORYZ